MTAKEYYELFKLRDRQEKELRDIRINERCEFLNTPSSIELRDSTLAFIKRYDAKKDQYKIIDLDDMRFHVLSVLLKCYWDTTKPDVEQVRKNLDALGLYMLDKSPSLHDSNSCYIRNSMYFMFPLFICLYNKDYDYTISYIKDHYPVSSQYLCSFVSMILYAVFNVDREVLEKFQRTSVDKYYTLNRHLCTMNILCNRYYYAEIDQIRSKIDLSDVEGYITYLDFAERMMPHLPESDNKFCDEIKKQFLETLKDPC